MHEVVVQKPAEPGLVHPEYPGGMLQRVFSSAYHKRDREINVTLQESGQILVQVSLPLTSM
jgi:hypothetical protein